MVFLSAGICKRNFMNLHPKPHRICTHLYLLLDILETHTSPAHTHICNPHHCCTTPRTRCIHSRHSFVYAEHWKHLHIRILHPHFIWSSFIYSPPQTPQDISCTHRCTFSPTAHPRHKVLVGSPAVLAIELFVELLISYYSFVSGFKQKQYMFRLYGV